MNVYRETSLDLVKKIEQLAKELEMGIVQPAHIHWSADYGAGSELMVSVEGRNYRITVEGTDQLTKNYRREK